jgi:hypothetical protein
MTILYIELNIWHRVDSSSAVLYRCLKETGTEKFAVQSADFFKYPVSEKRLHASALQFVELLIEISPADRCQWFNSVEEAIAAHNRDFY